MSAPLAPVPVPQLLKYAEDVELNVAPQQVNFVDLDGYGHRVAITLLTSVMNSAFYWSRPVDSVRPIGHFSDPTGAFAASLLASLNTDYTDNDAVTDKLTYDSAALNSNTDARIREGGHVSANDLMMAYVLYKVYGSSAASTKDIVFNLEDAYGMLKSADYADAIMSAFNNSELETSNPGNEKGAIDAMFRDLLSADSLRFFDAYGNQVPGIYEVSTDLSGSGTWNLVDGDTIEIRTVFTFTNSVTLRTSIDVAQNLNPLPTQSNGETVCIPAGTKLALRLQLVASDEGVSAPPSGSLSTVPTAPTSLALTPGNNSIFVSWDVPESDGNSVVTAYNLYLNGVKMTSMYGVFYTFRGLTNGSTYSVSVSAVNPRGESVFTTASVSLPIVTARPGAPTNLALASGDGSLVASWEAPAFNGGAAVIAYTVYNGDVVVGSTTNLSYTIAGLTNGSFYRISVTATNASGEGAKCSIVSGTPRIAPPRPASQVPTAPTSLSLTAGDTTIAASWGLPVSNGAENISSYNVYRDGVLIASSPNTSYILTGLQNGRSYSVAVTAVNLVGEGSACSSQSATPFSPPLPVFTAPDAPTNLQLSPANGLISASWSAPANNGGSSIIAYKLFIDNNVIPFNSTDTSYTFSALMNGYNYMISVSAVNAIGVGIPCVPASATPFVPPPAPTAPTAPTSLSMMAGDRTIAISWGLPVSNGGATITSYNVYNYGAPVGSSLNTSYNMTGLENGTNYSITVTAVNSAGEGAPCAAQQARPLGPGPIILNGVLTGYIGPIPANVTLGANVFSINPDVFQGSALESLDLSATSITAIEANSFYPCASLTSLILPSGLQTIGDQAFFQCTTLTSLILPSGLQTIGNSAFAGCAAITSLILPSGVTSLGAFVITGTSITSIIVPNGVTSLNTTFRGSPLVSVTLPSGLLSMVATFEEATALRSIVVPNGVTALLNGTFKDCPSLTSVSLPSTLLRLDSYDFVNCTSLTSIVIPNGVTYMGDYWTFRNCAAMTSVTLPSGLLSLPYSEGFSYCFSLTTITIPPLVTNIPSSTFIGTPLSLVTIPASFDLVAWIAILAAAGFSGTVTQLSPPPSAPGVPTNLQVMAGDGQVILSWNAPANNGGAAVTLYTVYNNGNAVGTSLLTYYTISGLQNGTPCNISVSATNSVGEGLPCSAQSATPVAPSPPPGPPAPQETVPDAPTNLQLTAGDGQVDVSWSAPANDGGAAVMFYTVYNNGNAIDNSSSTSYTMSGISNGTLCNISVSATNSVGEGLPCAAQSATPVAPVTTPSAPLALSAIAGDTTAAISWSAPESNGGSAILRYHVYNNGSFLGLTENTSYLIEQLTNGINYNVLVKAVNIMGEGQGSTRVYYIPVSTADGAAVASEPQNLAAVAGDRSAALTWDPPSSTGSGGIIVSYNIYVNDVIYANIDGALSSYTISPLTNDISYNIKMSSLNSAGESALTSQVSVMPVAPA